jgi:hypothetical protein
MEEKRTDTDFSAKPAGGDAEGGTKWCQFNFPGAQCKKKELTPISLDTDFPQWKKKELTPISLLSRPAATPSGGPEMSEAIAHGG